MISIKSLDEHREYLHQIIKLKLFFLRNWLLEHPDETLSAVLRKRIDIYRKTSINTGLLNPKILHFECPEWLELEHRLQLVYEQYKDKPAKFEEAGFSIFKETVDERVKRDYEDASRLAGYQCGSLRYNEYDDFLPHETTIFHIANALQPKSFFDDPQYLPQCFLELMRQSAEKYGSTRLETCTWLNSLPRWLEIFPREWQDNIEPENTDVLWNYGWWGQFITARGTFNYKYGEIMRKTGKMPFYPRTSSCSFDNMKKHLREKYLVSD